MNPYPMHQAILSLSRDNQLPRDSQQTLAASVNLSQALSDPSLLRSLLLGYTERVIALETKLADDAPKVAFHDAVAGASNTQSIQDAAKVLGIGPAKFFEWLRRAGILMPNNLPYQCHIDAGYFKVIQCSWTDKKDEKRLYARAMVTGKGMAYLQKCCQNDSSETVTAAGTAALAQQRYSQIAPDCPTNIRSIS